MVDEIIRIAEDGAVAIGLGVLIAYSYVKAYRGILVSMSFVHTCAATVLLVALAVGVIREAKVDAQALGFALVGILGLIRFRTVVRDTREFTFLFLSIVTGVLVGAGHQLVGTIGCILTLSLLIILEKVSFGSSRSIAFIAKITGSLSLSAKYCEGLGSIATRTELLSIQKVTSDRVTYIFEGQVLPDQDLISVAALLRSVESANEVSVQRLQRGKKEGESD